MKQTSIRPAYDGTGGFCFDLEAPGVKHCVIIERSHETKVLFLEIEREQQGQGIGSAVLRYLQGRGKPLRLLACAYDSDRQSDLERFYARAGFVTDPNDEDGSLVWEPGKKLF